MRACIHRGSRQIGGSCVEVESGGMRLLVDLGLPLDAERCDRSLLPDVSGLDGSDPSLLGILVSHPHLDHFGLLAYADPQIPVGMGAAARRILKAAAPFLPGIQPLESSGWSFRSEAPFGVGPFRITPYLVDHSAYDAYGFLIEADGRKLFYSGDFRGHGRKGKLLDRFITGFRGGVDALLVEGTSIGRAEAALRYETERELEVQFASAFADAECMVLVHAAAQNLDRLVTIFRACRRAGRILVIDLYTAAILEASGNPRLPQSDWPDVALYIPQRQRIQIKRNGWFDLLKRHSARRIFIEDLCASERRFVLLFRPLHCSDLENAVCLEKSLYIHSMWEGYREQESYVPLREWLSRNAVPQRCIHTSGHADIDALKDFVTAVAPAAVVPIHSFAPERYPEYFDKVHCRNDGEWWEV